MKPRAAFVPMILLLAACASSGPGEDLVPVYVSVDDVPCEYEVMETVRAEAAGSYRTDSAYRSAQSRYLGRAGRMAGADAVLVPERPDGARGMPFTIERGGSNRSTDMVRNTTFEGQAIRFVEGTCGGGTLLAHPTPNGYPSASITA